MFVAQVCLLTFSFIPNAPDFSELIIDYSYLTQLSYNSWTISINFIVQEIFYTSTHKTDHFQKIQAKTGVPYNSMLFFDDDNNNIKGVFIFTFMIFLIKFSNFPICVGEIINLS